MNHSFSQTTSVCPVCLKTIPAYKTVGEDGFIYLEKNCSEHGTFRTLIWEGDRASYEAWDNVPAGKVLPKGASPVQKGCPYDCGLCEDHERDGCCVLLELTNRCNLRCPVCFASAGEQTPQDLSIEEISLQYDLLMQRGGPFNIQLSGGEPTMRDDLGAIIALGKEKGFTFFQLNTNGIRIAKEDGYAMHLAQIGVSCVFLQFDGLDDSIYQTLRGCALKDTKLLAIRRCREAGLPVVLVPTLAPGVNDHAIGEILQFALRHTPYIRGVHIQPISYFGRCALTPPARRLTIPRILKNIEEQTDGLMKTADFGGGGAESPYCSFHASYLCRDDGTIKALARKQTQCCCVQSSDARDFVAQHWGEKPTPDPCCGGEPEPAEAQTCCCCDAEPAEAQVSCCGNEPELTETQTCCCCDAEPAAAQESCCGGEPEPAEVQTCCCCDAEPAEAQESCCCGEPEPTEAQTCCCCDAEPAEAQESCCGGSKPSVSDCCDTSSLDDFLHKVVESTFTVSGMLFQDAENLDLERLRRCYLCEADTEHGMVPFCAYNLTDRSGKALYRK